MNERLNKVLAQLGIGSRRSVDTLIAQGRVLVNNKPAIIGQRINPTDTITVDNKPVTRRPIEKVVIAFNKPPGVTTTKKDPFAKVTVMSYLPAELQHLNPIGRLDRESRGLLLLTNDGDLLLRLEHPKFGHEKEYAVTLQPSKQKTKLAVDHDLKRLQKEVINPEHQSKPIKLMSHSFDETKQHGNAVVVLQEGKKRQIRHLFAELGYYVTDLQRIRINQLRLANLKEGEYRRVDPNELKL